MPNYQKKCKTGKLAERIYWPPFKFCVEIVCTVANNI